MLLFNLYISIVNRKISWPILVLNCYIHYSMLYLAASRIWMGADTLGDITLFSFFLQTHARH